MLDSDIAAYFGVTTGNLNKAMKRNIKRFPPKFCFMLTKEEYREILRFQTGILELEQGKYSKYLPYVYTEHGLSMLTSVLHTDRAIEASILIMEVFVEVAHYILQFKADFAYQKIYGTAEKNIIVIDDYLGLKTLRHLASAKSGIQITIISNNKGKNPLKLADYDDFLKEYPDIKIKFIASYGRINDRYIAIDFDTEKEKLYHCGASSKDAGHRITTITEIKGIADYKNTLESLLLNRELNLN